MPFDAGSVVVGVQVGGMTAFVDGWKAMAATVAKAVADIGSELFKNMKDVGEAAEKWQNLAQQTGLSATMIQRLDNAAKLTGTSIGTLAQGLNQAVREGKLLGGDEGLNAALRTLNEIPDAGERAAKAFELFGRSGDEMITVAQQMGELNAEMDRFGLTLTETEIKLGGEFDDSMDRVEGSVRGLWQTLSVQAMPVVAAFGNLISDHVPKITAWVKENNWLGKSLKYIVDSLAVLGLQLALAGDGLDNISRRVGNYALSVVQSMRAMTTGMTSEVAQRVMGVDPAQMQRGIDALEQWAIKLRRDGKDIAADSLAIGAAMGQLKKDAEAIIEPVRGAAGSVGQLGKAMADSAALSISETWSETGTAKSSSVLGGVEGTGEPAKKEITSVEQDLGKAYGRMAGHVRAFVTASASAWQSYMKQGKGVMSSLGQALKEAVASMAMSEGMYHFLAGLAMMFAPGMRAQGQHRMTNGAMLMALGAAFGAATGAGASEGGGGGSAASSEAPTTPGSDLSETKEKRPQISIIVQGSMFDTRETWSRIAELSNEFSDHDIKLAVGSVAA